VPGPRELPAQQRAPIIGREAGLARLRGLVDPVPQASQVLVVTGEAGMGKTVLLAGAAGISFCGRSFRPPPGFPAGRPGPCWGRSA
jgi:hypothetical protein